MKWFLITMLIIAVLLVLFSLWQNKLPTEAVGDMVTGVVSDDPQSLADAAGVDLETYSLARVGQSEEGLSSDRAKIAVMYACKHHADAKGTTITDIVTKGNPKRSDYTEANGRYGRQGIHPYCSSIAAPKSGTLALAAAVLNGSVADETQGAQYWDNPHTQDILATANPKNPDTGEGYYTSAQIAEKRIAKGNKLVTISGIGTRFWV
jgi:hypothetical protein